jgi:O-acetyl-ADP-ribose deacetylase (regulator of RNase III)
MIHYVKGDVTKITGYEPKLIIHVCNNRGAWGAGFVLSLSRKWKLPEYYYRRRRKHILGDVQFVETGENSIVVANMIAQVLGSKDGINIRYASLRKCLYTVHEYAVKHNCTIHAPRFGSGLAGGDWTIIERMINRILSDVRVYIYDLK